MTIAILAMGGEGGGVLADWIVDVAERSGYYAQTTSVPGVAQRTGATIYYLELFPETAARAVGKDPILALMPVPGDVDIVIASELMEAGRAIQRGLVTPDRTTFIASTNRVYSMTEKTAVADGRVDSQTLIDAGQSASRKFVHSDFARIAEENRSVISAALFGALAATGSLPFTRGQFEEAIRRGGVGVESSLAAFNVSFSVVTNPAASIANVETARKPGPRLEKLVARIEKDFPPASHNILLPAIERLTDYQDEGYAARYLDLLATICEFDSRHGGGSYNLLRETGRYLALWMSYEDASRVADLKLRRARFERVQRDARASAAQLVQINEFLHPRISELADTLPAGLGQWLLDTRWVGRIIERFTQHGRIVQTTSLSGFLLLYAVAEQRRWRRRSLRFQREHGKINQWLAQVSALAPEDYELAVAAAESARLLKGYGDTYQRGCRNFETMMNAIPKLQKMPGAAGHMKNLCTAALADESGQKLAEALRAVAA